VNWTADDQSFPEELRLRVCFGPDLDVDDAFWRVLVSTTKALDDEMYIMILSPGFLEQWKINLKLLNRYSFLVVHQQPV